MHVIATAGHVDHGKSTLVQALTGTDPDRLEEEHARGLSIELGYAWTVLPGAGDVAFVDVPGHERFVSTMLSGVGAVPAALLVVAADDPWMPQAAEHLEALDALGIRHGVVAVTRSDLADPAGMVARAQAEVAATSFADAPVVAVSAVTGEGLAELRTRLAEMVGRIPQPAPEADVRLWVDRCFHVRGAGTVVTGTLPAGTVTVGATLELPGHEVRVRGVQSLGQPRQSVSGVARVALNITGAGREVVDRHSVLVTPGRWHHTRTVDVRYSGAVAPPRMPSLHVGSVAVPAYFRPLGDGTARLSLAQALPLRLGDRALLRDPGSRRLWGATVLDPAPPALQRRGAGSDRARLLAESTGNPDAGAELSRRGIVAVGFLRRIGVDPGPLGRDATPDGWLLSEEYAAAARARLEQLVRDHERSGPVEHGVPLGVLAERLGLPSAAVVESLVQAPLRVAHGRVTSTDRPTGTELPEHVARAVAALEVELRDSPFAAPTADRLDELGLDARAVTLAARRGRLLHLGSGVVLLPGTDELAAKLLLELPQPFTTSQARVHLATSRRTVLPLLQLLDRQGRTRRHPDDRRSVARGR